MDTAIGCDIHKRYSVFVTVDSDGQPGRSVRVEHEAAPLRAYLAEVPRGTAVAFETTEYWHWFADLLEEVGLQPRARVLGARFRGVNSRCATITTC